MKPKPFDGLKEAITGVLDSADPDYPAMGEMRYIVSRQALTNLQAEYNIHFVEPDAPQLEIIK